MKSGVLLAMFRWVRWAVDQVVDGGCGLTEWAEYGRSGACVSPRLQPAGQPSLNWTANYSHNYTHKFT